MVDALSPKMLRLAPAMVIRGLPPGLSLEAEQGFGIAKLRCFQRVDYGTAFHALTGVPAPEPLRQVVIENLVFSWLGPNEWFVTGPEPAITAWVRAAEERGGDDMLVVDVTHGCQPFLLGGPAARTTLAAHCPLDLGEAGYPVGAVARSLLGDMVMFIARLGDTDGSPCFRIIVDQTMGAYAARLLARA